jgi:hypothetical protein
MKKRGLFIILAAMLGFIFLVPVVRASLIFWLVVNFIGLLVLVFDFREWLKRRVM